MTALTQERLKELLHYDPNTDVWTWRVSNAGTKAGAQAGHTYTLEDRTIIGIDYKIYNVRNLAGLYMTGKWPVFNSTGVKGVYPNGKRFKAIITKDGKQVYLGTHDTIEGAAELYDFAKDLHGEFAKFKVATK
jgi:hypothetical protein